MKKMIFFWIYFVLAIILAIYFASRILTNQMNMGPVSEIKDVVIIGDTEKSDYIKNTIGITPGTKIKNIYDKTKDYEHNKTEKINKNTLKIPLVKNASTRFLPNGVVVVKVQQHDIVATWSDGMYYYPLSAEGTVIEYPQEKPIENTILFIGKTKDGLTEIVDVLKPLKETIDYVELIESRRWNVHLKNGVVIYLPEENINQAVSNLVSLHKQHKILSRAIKVIDLRNNQKILVKTTK